MSLPNWLVSMVQWFLCHKALSVTHTQHTALYVGAGLYLDLHVQPYPPSPMTDILTSPQVMSHPSGLRQHCKHQIFLGFPLHSVSSVICSVCASQDLTGTFENLVPFNTDNTVPLLTKWQGESIVNIYMAWHTDAWEHRAKSKVFVATQ